MSDLVCRNCRRTVRNGERHYCSSTGRSSIVDDSDSSGDFILSSIIGAATDSALLGGLLGGSMIGGIFGDVLDGDLFD